MAKTFARKISFLTKKCFRQRFLTVWKRSALNRGWRTVILFDHVIRFKEHSISLTKNIRELSSLTSLVWRRFYGVKCKNYIRARSARRIIIILQIKSKEALILPTLSLQIAWLEIFIIYVPCMFLLGSYGFDMADIKTILYLLKY